MKKLLLSTAIAATLGVSGVAHAKIDLNDDDASTNGSLTFASELAIDATNGTKLTESSTGGELDLLTEVGFSINSGSTRFVRYELSNGATFTNDPDAANVVFTDTNSSGAAVAFNKAAGGAGESFVVYEVTASTGDVAPDDTFELPLDGITVVSEQAVVASYALFETATAATNNGTALASSQQQAISFDSALEVVAEEANEDQIEVATNSTEFDDNNPSVKDLTTKLAQVQITMSGALDSDSTAAVIGDVVGTDASLIVNGDFSAVAKDSNGNPDKSKVLVGSTNATELTETQATFKLGQNTFTDTNEAVVTMEVTGEDVIPDVAFTASYTVDTPTNYDTSDVNLGVVSELEKNGDEEEVNMLLDPNGAFKNFVRLTNGSTVEGAVFITLYNDGGESVSFDLSDVSVKGTALSAGLSANESTQLIPVSALVAAAQAADSSFDVTSDARNKLRVVVDGEFADLRVDNVTLATDNSTFSTF